MITTDGVWIEIAAGVQRSAALECAQRRAGIYNKYVMMTQPGYQPITVKPLKSPCAKRG